MKRALCVLLLTPLLALCQLSRIGVLPNRHHLPGEGLVAAYFMGPDGPLNPSADYWQPDNNLLLWSEDVSNAGWTKTDATADSATLLTFDAQNGLASQSITTITGVQYTLSFKVRRITGNTALHFYHNGLTPASTAFTATATLTRYSVTVTGDGGAVSFGIQDQNAAGHGQIELTEIQLNPGATAAEYQKTEAKQSLHDWSGQGNHGQRGSTTGSDTNDPSITPTCRNLLAAGSTEDLQEWTASETPVVTATTVEDDNGAAYESISQLVAAPDATIHTWTIWVLKDAVLPATRFPEFRPVVNTYYRVRLDTSSGASTETAACSGSHTVTSDGLYWKVAVTFTTDDGNGISAQIFPAIGANADLTTSSAAATGSITILKQQLEVGDAATTYINPASEAMVQDWDFVTDDYVVTDPLTLDSDWTFLAVLKPDDNTSVGLWRNGAAAPNVSLDAAGKVSYEPALKNLMAEGSTEDLEHAAWYSGGAAVNDATHLTFSAQNGNVYQQVSTLDGVSYTLSFAIRAVSGNTSLRFYHGFSETGDDSALNVTDVLTRYSVTMLGKSGGGNVNFGIWDANGSGWGQVEVTEWQVEVGSSATPYGVGDPIVATNAVDHQWQVVAITKSGTTIAHYLNGAANGSGTSSSGNAFAALRIGYDGTAYYDGGYAAFAAYNRALSPGTILRWQREVVKRWAYDKQNHREMDLQ